MEQVIIEILKSAPVAAVLFYFVVTFKKDTTKAQEKYDTLVNTVIEKSENQNKALVETVSRNTNIMERVERKLDEKH